MAKAYASRIIHPDFKVVIELTPDEAGALGAIAGYDEKAFLKVFEEHMGKHYIEPYRHAIKPLFESLRGLDNRVSSVRKKLNELEL